MTGNIRRVSPFWLFVLVLLLVAIVVSCVAPPPTTEIDRESAPQETPIPVILPPEESGSVIRESTLEDATYFVATGSICSTLMDTMLQETYRVLDSWDFWTFHVNFQPPPPALLELDSTVDFVGCFRLYGRTPSAAGITGTYYPFAEYLLTPCYTENGSVPVDTPRLITSTGLLTGTAPMTRTLRQVEVGSALFDGTAYIRCDFNLTALESQYFNMVRADPITIESLPPEFTEDPEAMTRFSDAITRNGNGDTFRDLTYFAMAAAVPSMATDLGAADIAWADYATLTPTELRPPVSHPAIFMMPKCHDVDYESAFSQMADWRAAGEGDPSLDPYEEWSQLLADTMPYEECTGSIQLGATTLPAVAADSSHPDYRVAIAAEMIGKTWLPDFATWGATGCKKAGYCGFPAPAGGQPTYLWVQYGDLYKVNDTDPCLVPQGAAPTAWAVDDLATPPATYNFYINQKFLIPNTYLWQTWCSPTMAPSVLTHAQGALDFWQGNTDIYIGYNPITGQTFMGALDEIWIDPDHSIGT